MQTASDYFGSMVTGYDSLIRRAVPVYREMIERLLTYLPVRAERVLELGCGTGNLTEGLARRYPDAQFTLVDGSAEMLSVASARLGPAAANARCLEARFEEVELEPDGFDLITSCVSLHHVREKPALFARVRDWLELGGVFVYADQMRGVNDDFHAINWSAMTEFWRIPGNLDDGEIESLEVHARDHDHYEPIVPQLRALEGAGFKELDVVWRSWMWGIVTARAN